MTWVDFRGVFRQAILPSVLNMAFESYVVLFVTILHFPQVLGEDEFVKCLHSVGVRIIVENFSILSKIGGKATSF